MCTHTNLTALTPLSGYSQRALRPILAKWTICSLRSGSAVADVGRKPAVWTVDDHAHRGRELVVGGVDVDVLCEAGDDECEFHLGKCEADAVAGSAAERDPSLSGEGLLVEVRSDEAVGVEPERFGPCGSAATGEIRGPPDEGPFGIVCGPTRMSTVAWRGEITPAGRRRSVSRMTRFA